MTGKTTGKTSARSDAVLRKKSLMHRRLASTETGKETGKRIGRVRSELSRTVTLQHRQRAPIKNFWLGESDGTAVGAVSNRA